MGFAHLLSTNATVVAFKARFNIPHDVNIEYCPKGDIENDRHPRVVFFFLMVILKGGVRFYVDPLLLTTFSFYGLSLDQCLPNFYRVLSSVSRLNSLYILRLNHIDINFLYSICGGLKNDYYLKIGDFIVRLISCLLDSNRNSTKEFIKVSGNWLASELTCPTSPQQIGRYLCFLEHK